MGTWDANGMEHEPFDGTVEVEWGGYESPAPRGHGRRCSANPEIGCVCGEDERGGQDREARSLGFRSHAHLEEAMGPERMAALSRTHNPTICPNPARCENCQEAAR